MNGQDGTSLTGQLDRLPLTPRVWRVACLAAIAWVVESLSIGSLGVALPALKSIMASSPSAMGLLAVSSTFGIVVGLIPAGKLADRFGRKTLLFWGILLYSTMTLVSALSPNLWTLVLLRFLAGLGMGAVFPIPYVMVAEIVGGRRAFLSGVMDSSLSVGYLFAPLLGLLILPHFTAAMSWRVLFIFAGMPWIYAFVIRRYLPESPRWLIQSGNLALAEKTVAWLADTTQPFPRGKASATPARPKLSVNRESPFKSPYLRSTLVSAWAATATFLMFYVVMTYLPTIFTREGNSFAASLGYSALVIAAAIPGKLINGTLADRFGRKPMYLLFMGIAGAAAVFFGQANTPGAATAFASVMSFFGTGAFAGLKMSYAEQYPTVMRSSGSASVETIGRLLGGVVGAYLMPWLWTAHGLNVAFWWIAATVLSACIVTALWGTETARQPLKDTVVVNPRPSASPILPHPGR